MWDWFISKPKPTSEQLRTNSKNLARFVSHKVVRSIKKGRSYSSSSSPRLRHRSRRHHSPLALSRRSRRSSSSSSSYRPKSRSRPRELDSAIQVLRKKLQKLELEYVDATETEGNTARLQRMVDKLQAQLQAASQEYASALAAKRERQARRGITPAQITQVTREALAATAAAAHCWRLPRPCRPPRSRPARSPPAP